MLLLDSGRALGETSYCLIDRISSLPPARFVDRVSFGVRAACSDRFLAWLRTISSANEGFLDSSFDDIIRSAWTSLPCVWSGELNGGELNLDFSVIFCF